MTKTETGSTLGVLEYHTQRHLAQEEARRMVRVYGARNVDYMVSIGRDGGPVVSESERVYAEAFNSEVGHFKINLARKAG